MSAEISQPSSHGINISFVNYNPPPPVGSGGLGVPGGLATELLGHLLLMSIYINILICDRSSLWELIFYYIFDIMDSTMNAEESVLTGGTVEESYFTVSLRRPDPQVSIVS